MMTEYKKLHHTAITTWSGFIYQGKIALYHVLKNLCKDTSYSTYTLQLDSLEDFAVLDGAEVISMHQVKAMKSSYYSSYSAAFDKLKNKALEQSCKAPFFHVAVEIKDKTALEIQSNHAPIKIYKYEDKKYYCSLEDVDSKIEALIRQYFQTYCTNEPWRADSDEYIIKTRNYLDQIILKKIINIHTIVHKNLMSDRAAATKETIVFSEFVEILNENLAEKGRDKSYYFYILLSDIHRYYQEYCFELHDADEESLIKLSKYLLTMEQLSYTNMVRFIQNVIPHRTFKFNDLKDYKDSNFTEDEIKDAFLQILNELKEATFHPENFFLWKDSKYKSYTPTSIIHPSKNSSKICSRIIDQAIESEPDVLFERNNLITLDIDEISILDAANNVTEELTEDTMLYKKITHCKNISLVSLEKAKAIIND